MPEPTALSARPPITEESWAKRFSAYGALFVTVAVFALLCMGLIVSARLDEPPAAFNNLMETIKALAMVCTGYWVGSSNSSARKDDTIAAGTAALAVSAPVAALLAAPPAPAAPAAATVGGPGAMRPTVAPR